MSNPTVCRHSWRLLDETRRTRPTTSEERREALARDGSLPVTVQTGWVRRWYCTRCRTVETTTEEAA